MYILLSFFFFFPFPPAPLYKLPASSLTTDAMAQSKAATIFPTPDYSYSPSSSPS